MKSYLMAAFRLAIIFLIVGSALANDKAFVGRSKVDPRDWDDGENWLPPGAPANGDRVSIGVPPYSGTFTVNIRQSIDLAGLSLVRSTINGASRVSVNGSFYSEGGSFSGGLEVILNGGGGAKRGGGGEYALGLYGCRIENHGTFAVSTNSTLAFAQRPSLFLNQGTVELSGGSGISFSGAGDSLFDNRGILQNAADGTIASVDSVFLHNAGTIRAQAGTLRFNLGRITNSAKITADLGATNLFAAGATLVSNNGSELTGGGWHRLVGAPWIVRGNTYGAFVEFNGQAATLALESGAELELAEVFSWTSGTIEGVPGQGRVLVNAVRFDISGAGLKTLRGALLQNDGECNWTDPGGIALQNSATILNTGAFRIQNNSVCDGLGTFVNKGLTQKAVADTNHFTTFLADFNNEGTLSLSGANLALAGGTSRGLFRVRDNAELQFYAKTHVLQGGAGGGEGARFSGNAFVTITGTATFEVRNEVIADRLWLAGEGIAKIQLAGLLTVGEQFNWSAGTILGNAAPRGLLSIGNSALGSIRGTSRKTLQAATLSNDGTLEWTGGELAVTEGAILENGKSKLFRIESDSSLLGGGAPSRLSNYGLVLKTSPGFFSGTTTIGAGVRFENGAIGGEFDRSLEVRRGSLVLDGGGTFQRQALLAEGTTLVLRHDNYRMGEATVAGPGLLKVAGGTILYTLNSDLLMPFRFVPVRIDNLELSAGALEPVATNLVGYANLEIAKQFTWTGGTIGSPSSSPFSGSFSSTAQTIVSGADTKWLLNAGAFFAGTVNWTGPGVVSLEFSALYLGAEDRAAVVETSGQFKMVEQDNRSYVDLNRFAKWIWKPGSTGSIQPELNSQGTLVFENGEYSLGKFNVRNGQVDLNGSQLKVANLQMTGGQLTGNGTLEGPVQNSGGDIRPGHSPGRLLIRGDYTQEATGRTVVELSGVIADSVDLLEIAGRATLGGTLQVRLLEPFVPKLGDRFEVLKFASISNTFQLKEGFLLPDRLMLVPIYSQTNLVLSVVAAPALVSPTMQVTFQKGALALEWPSNPGVTYQLESSTDLDHWTVWSHLTEGAIAFPPASTAEPRRFFRLR